MRTWQGLVRYALIVILVVGFGLAMWAVLSGLDRPVPNEVCHQERRYAGEGFFQNVVICSRLSPTATGWYSPD